jgi:Zn-dependent protease
MLANIDIAQLIYLAITFVISISIHEYAHAWTSNQLGDPTPKLQGRLTPNPLVHIDPMWFLLIFIIWFGWWKPVIVNPSYYKNPIKDELLVALAWPLSNIILAIAWTVIMHLYMLIAWVENMYAGTDPIIQFWTLFGWLNVALAVFNMIPIPPLDGYRLLVFFFPKSQRFMQKYTMYFGIILLGLIFLPGVSHILMWFITTTSQAIYGIIQALVASLFFW